MESFGRGRPHGRWKNKVKVYIHERGISRLSASRNKKGMLEKIEVVALLPPP